MCVRARACVAARHRDVQGVCVYVCVRARVRVCVRACACARVRVFLPDTEMSKVYIIYIHTQIYIYTYVDKYLDVYTLDD